MQPGKYVSIARRALADSFSARLEAAPDARAVVQLAGERLLLVASPQDGAQARGAWITPAELMLLRLLEPEARLRLVDSIRRARGGAQ